MALLFAKVKKRGFEKILLLLGKLVTELSMTAYSSITKMRRTVGI